MNRLLLALLLPLLASLVACTPDDPFVPSPRPGDTIDLQSVAFLRIIHASPDAGPAQVAVGNDLLFGGSPQKYFLFETGLNEAKYYPVDTSTGTSSTQILFKSGSSTIAGTTTKLKRGEYYTAFLYGAKGSYHVLFTSDTLQPKPSLDSSRYRIVHLSPDSPPLDVKEGPNRDDAATIAEGVVYGSASPYIRGKSYPIGAGTGLYILNSLTKQEILGVDPPFIILPSETVFTIVMTGAAKPSGNEEFIHLNLFQENRTPNPRDQLYGGLPINIDFGAVRLINLVAMGDTNSLDLTFLDNLRQEKYIKNQYYRKDMTNSQGVVRHIFFTDLQKKQDSLPPYFVLSLLLRSEYPFEVEIHQTIANFDEYLFAFQPRLVDGPRPLVMQKNQRYTIYAYGPFDTTRAKATVVQDNVTLPGAGMATVRFFHGSVQDSTKKLRVRVGSATGRAMSYGEAPDAVSGSLQVATGVYRIEVIDESGTTVYSQDGLTLGSDRSYTLAMSNGWKGDTRTVSVIPEEVIIK